MAEMSDISAGSPAVPQRWTDDDAPGWFRWTHRLDSVAAIHLPSVAAYGFFTDQIALHSGFSECLLAGTNFFLLGVELLSGTLFLMRCATDLFQQQRAIGRIGQIALGADGLSGREPGFQLPIMARTFFLTQEQALRLLLQRLLTLHQFGALGTEDAFHACHGTLLDSQQGVQGFQFELHGAHSASCCKLSSAAMHSSLDWHRKA